MRKLLSTIALAALAATTLHADPGGGKGQRGGKEGGNGGVENRGGKEDRGGKSDRGWGAMRENRGDGDHDKSADKQRRADRDWTRSDGDERSGKGRDKREEARDDGSDGWRVSWREFDRRGLVNGCPPGLAKKHNGCMPPGQAKKYDHGRYDANWWGLRGLSNVAGYRYIDGNLVRLSPNGSVMSYYPLLGGALSVGNQWPSGWQPTPLTPYYSNYYGLGDDYRYYDGAIYNVDPRTSTIQRIAALLTGDNFAVGQRIPAGYSAYNVPYQYRDRYIDGPDAYYRYSDGYVYQTDPKTQLILAVIKLLT